VRRRRVPERAGRGSGRGSGRDPEARATPAAAVEAGAEALILASRRLSAALATVRFAPPVAYVYHPLIYARALHEDYLRRYGQGRKRVIFLGMNPGPFGMAQTGVPFGDVGVVRDWLQLAGEVTQPAAVHPQRPIQGLSCPRREVSGSRLWGGMRARFGSPQAFFHEHFVANYCPLAFLEASGRNRTPDQLPARSRAALEGPCQEHLQRLVAILQPQWVVGVGRFAEAKARTALAGISTIAIAHIPHPSPASPQANAGWFAAASAALVAQGVWPGEGEAEKESRRKREREREVTLSRADEKQQRRSSRSAGQQAC
jgi:single-strand selective monofunctional uracil DNA glycosylase